MEDFTHQEKSTIFTFRCILFLLVIDHNHTHIVCHWVVRNLCLKDKIEDKKLWIIRKVKKDSLCQIEAADFSNFKIWQAGRTDSISIPCEKIINKSKVSRLFGKDSWTRLVSCWEMSPSQYFKCKGLSIWTVVIDWLTFEW